MVAYEEHVFGKKSQKDLEKDDGRVKILFIDETNSLQSQIAEYFLNDMYGEKYAAYSAGTKFNCIDCELVSVMYQNGYDIRRARAKDFRSKQMPTKFSKLYFLERATYDRVNEIVPYDAEKEIVDFGSKSDFKATDDVELYEAYCDLIERVKKWVSETFA